MDGATTTLIDPSNPRASPKKFTYDYSYWSHDGFTARQDGYHEKTSDKYVDQVRVTYIFISSLVLQDYILLTAIFTV